jgi:lysophospholipase L1-like esterase
MRTKRWLATAALSLAAATGACENETLLRPANTVPVDPLFERYVAIGNSITAGFQSFGINDSTQALAYPVLLARAMGSTFFVPYMNRPGCPGPLTNVFTQARVGGGGAGFCALRKSQSFPPPFLSNLGVPGAEVVEAFNYFDPTIVPSATDVYRTFLLGGYTPVAAARRARPTFVTVWLGNNDVLGAVLDMANAGNPALVTPSATFATRYAALMDSLDQIGTIQGGVLIGVVHVVLAPYSSTGRAYAAAAAAIPTLTVNPNCLVGAAVPGGQPPLDSVFVSVPFHYGAPLVSQAAAGVPTTLDCSVPQVISTAEALNMVAEVGGYNAAIAQAAQARGWVYLDPNALLVSLLGSIRPFPAFPPDPAATTAPFGAALSHDGVHPSSSTHRLIAQSLRAVINAVYNTSIPAIP